MTTNDATDTRPRLGFASDAPEDTTQEQAARDAFQVVSAIKYQLPRLIKAARAGTLAEHIVEVDTWGPERPGAPLWAASLAPDLHGQALNVQRNREGGQPVEFFDFDGVHGVAYVEWPADHAALSSLDEVSREDLAFLTAAFDTAVAAKAVS